MLAKLLRDKEIGELVVPIVPDEARTFGMEALFRQVGIYSRVGQLYEPELARALFERAPQPKRFVLVEGGSHHNTNSIGQGLYRQALRELFGLAT